MKAAPLKLAAERFDARFGEGGQLRQKLGESGRVHLDRWLPFLVLHRSADPSISIARRVAVNSPAYLVWSPDEDSAAGAACAAIIDALLETFDRILLITLEDAPWQRREKDSPELPPFVAVTSCCGDARAERALDELDKAMLDVEIELRRAKVQRGEAEPDRVVDAWVSGRDDVDRLSLTIPQIHRTPDGGFYPQLTHDLAVACGDALLQAAFAFMDGGRPGAPAHYRSLGRSAFLSAALHADKKLDEISRSFDFLLSISPINTRKAMERFFDNGEERAPRFRYRPLTIDPDEAKRDLYRIDLSLLEDPLLERLLKEKRREIDHQLTMLATRNTADFRPASLLLYGSVDPHLLDDARAILSSAPPAAPRGKPVGAAGVAVAAIALIESYQTIDRRFEAEVEIRADVTGLLVSGGKLLVASDTGTTAGRLDALLAHEVSVHLLTHFNGAAQGLSIFRTGLADYEGVQEGLGVFAEWAVGGLTSARLRQLAGRVVAVDAMLGGADFIEVYRLLKDGFGFTRTIAFDVAARVLRSGGLAKDAIYLKGFRYVVDRVAAGESLAPFWLGKIAPRHIEPIEELLQRGLLREPIFQPEFLSRDDARRRIARLGAGLPFNRILVE